MCPVYTWWLSLETALVTGSLLFVAPGRRLAELSDCEFVRHGMPFSEGLLPNLQVLGQFASLGPGVSPAGSSGVSG